MGSYLSYMQPLYSYDKLFGYIQGNEELARSVARFVPWVKSSKDLVQLLDVYLVQTTAKRVMRYHFYDIPNAAGEIAAVLGPDPVSHQMMEWLFARTFVYPLRPAGTQDLMIVGCDREGAQYIGSTFYAQGEGGIRHAKLFDQYLSAGGNPRFDLRDPVRYPKAVAQCFWQLEIMVGGADFLRIGDVTGPDKSPFATVPALEEASRLGWKWSGDARFAWLLKNVYGKKHETDEEWQRIGAAAAAVRRAPWLDLRSRLVDNWAGVLETGLAHDGYRLRRAAYVRAGLGIGHAQGDTLDLQVVAHGLPMTIDGGQRTNPTYSRPKDRVSRVHNLVEVDGADHAGYAWVQTLSDAEGARYLRANALPPPGVRLLSRQVALLDVDEGGESQPLTLEQQKPGADLPRIATTGNSYVFDVFRVAGGKTHSYCFHGPVSDDFQWNAEAVAPVRDAAEGAQADEDASYLAPFALSSGAKLAGQSPEPLQATWRYARAGEAGTEPQMLKGNYDADSPRKFTRLTLLNAAGLRALKADVVTTDACPAKYRFPCVMLRKGDPAGRLESAFAAIIEPYAGSPFITSARHVDVADNEADAQRPVAVEVQTANGHTDLCFADGRAGKVRSIPMPDSTFRISAEFAYCSTDADGLRQATLTGGTLLEGPDVRIEPQQAERTGKVVQLDYLKKTLWLDTAWPAGTGAGLFEIGVPDRMASYTAVAARPDGGRTAITVRGGADFFRSPILKVDPATGVVQCAIGLTFGVQPGMDKHWVASNDAMTAFWRAECMSEDTFKLSGAPLTEDAFGKERALRLWEYGVGDTVRRSACVSLRRIEPGVFEVDLDVDAEIRLKAASAEMSSDKGTWTPIPGVREGEDVRIGIKAADCANGPILLRIR